MTLKEGKKISTIWKQTLRYPEKEFVATLLGRKVMATVLGSTNLCFLLISLTTMTLQLLRFTKAHATGYGRPYRERPALLLQGFKVLHHNFWPRTAKWGFDLITALRLGGGRTASL